MIISTTATMEEGQRVLSWNEFQKANKGRAVTVEEWREHRRKVLSSRPVRPLVPTSVDVPSSSDTKNCDRPAGDADERHEKRDAAAARWKKLFATQSPARAEDESPGPITTQDQSVSLSSSLAKRGRPSSGRGSKGGSHRKNKRSDDGRPSTKEDRSVAKPAEESGSSATRSTSTAERPKPRSKKERVDWSTETERLSLAIDACKNGLSVHEAGRMFGVPFSVLQRRITGSVNTHAALGAKPVISEEWEQRLHDHILKLADLGFGIDWCDIRALAVKIAEAEGKKDFVAGGGWTDGFKNRFPDLARLRTAALERNRMGALNQELVGSFYDLLDKSIKRVEELSGGTKLTPDRILNVDEIGFTLNMTAGYIVGRRNSRHAHAATGNSRDHVSAATTIRADGSYLPHFFLLAGKRSKAEHMEEDGRLKGTPPGSAFVLTEKGYMTDAAYSQFADHLIHHENAARKDDSLWSLLICDGYNSHAMLPDVLDKLWKAKIYVISFPSHTSSELQPLDITCFRPVKNHFRRAIHTARLEKGLVSISKWQVPAIASDSFEKALTTTNVCAGFTKAGIHPLKMDWVSTHKHVFAVSESLAQPSSEDAIAALRHKKFDELIQASPPLSPAQVQYLDLSMSDGQQASMSRKTDPKTATPVTEKSNPEEILVLPKPTEKKKSQQKRRANIIGESFAAPKQLNEPERVHLLREHSKRKADELLSQQAEKKAKKDAEEPVAKVLKSLGYLSSEKVTVAAMKTFLRRNSAVAQMPKSATHPKKEEILAFLRSEFAKKSSEEWRRAD